jgi:DNA-directed RNA polymerase specialized sigma24 family protein
VNGDHPARAIPNSAIINDYHRWRLKMACVYLPYSPNDWHDLAQEGAVAMWQALDTYDPDKGSLPSWLTVAAKMRMRHVVRRGTWTGMPLAKGHTRMPLAIPVEITEHDRIASGMHDIDAAMDVRAAVAALSPSVRRAIFARFWLDEPVETGMWARSIPQLRQRLAHLT